MKPITRDDALAYHRDARAGKIEMLPCKPCSTQRQLSLAYSPGVAEACRAIVADPEAVFELTARGNLVGVVSNGTAVLGLGDIGPLAGKPVMEGKAVLFKVFADIDCYTVDVKEDDADALVELVKRLEPTFGGINLEDIKAPECFVVETRCKAEMDIPVFHDDQHGTAIISGAGLLNACEITGRKLSELKVVISGAGAGAIACANFYVSLGVERGNIWMFDSKGLLTTGRGDLNEYKLPYAQDCGAVSLAKAFAGADCFLGLSRGGLVKPEWLAGMNRQPIIFACANPDPEITFNEAKIARPDCIMGTGRSDYPNQINNVLGFPFIFRGALDVRATSITEGMKRAAAHSLAALAKEPVPEQVRRGYGGIELSFGPDYIIPKPIDPRIIEWESLAVARAAMEEGVARKQIDLAAYPAELAERRARCQQRIAQLIGHYSLDEF